MKQENAELSHKITTWENIGVPGQHSCHVGEWQGLEWDTKVDIYKILQNLNPFILHQQYELHVNSKAVEFNWGKGSYVQRWKA